VSFQDDRASITAFHEAHEIADRVNLIGDYVCHLEAGHLILYRDYHFEGVHGLRWSSAGGARRNGRAVRVPVLRRPLALGRRHNALRGKEERSKERPSACDAEQDKVGMPSGRREPSALGVHVLRTGGAL
jgi:hypothetical protein